MLQGIKKKTHFHHFLLRKKAAEVIGESKGFGKEWKNTVIHLKMNMTIKDASYSQSTNIDCSSGKKKTFKHWTDTILKMDNNCLFYTGVIEINEYESTALFDANISNTFSFSILFLRNDIYKNA